MVINRVSTIRTSDICAYAWRGLNLFQNVDHAADEIVRVHQLPAKHRSNARKQAEQLKFCLAQAKEYFTAADAVSLATRPVLLYYGVMSLALAEVLLKQTADSRLAKLRADHNCHGLALTMARSPTPSDDLSTSLDCLRAKPQTASDGTPKGTFEVWRRSARECPIGGFLEKKQSALGTSTKGFEMLFQAFDKAPPQLKSTGISLRDCVQNLPYMAGTLATWGVGLDMVRATVSREVEANLNAKTFLILHPTRQSLLDRFMELPLLRPGDTNHVDIVEFPSGYVIQYSEKLEAFSLPQAICLNDRDVFFSCARDSVGEFGHTFIAMHILGNFARYYPDVWMDHLARCSPLATVADVLCSEARERMPLLALSEMTRTYLIPER